jgi:hypothetical protein
MSDGSALAAEPATMSAEAGEAATPTEPTGERFAATEATDPGEPVTAPKAAGRGRKSTMAAMTTGNPLAAAKAATSMGVAVTTDDAVRWASEAVTAADSATMAAESTEDDDLAATAVTAVTSEPTIAMTTAMAAIGSVTASSHHFAAAVMATMPDPDMTALVMRAAEAVHEAVTCMSQMMPIPVTVPVAVSVSVSVSVSVADKSATSPITGPRCRPVTATEAVAMMSAAGGANRDRAREHVAVVVMSRMTARYDDDANGLSGSPRMSAADDRCRHGLHSRSDHTMATCDRSGLAVAATSR